MYCNHRVYEILLSAIIIIFALWNSTINWLPSKWVIVIAAAILLIHALSRKRMVLPKISAKSKAVSKKAKKKRR